MNADELVALNEEIAGMARAGLPLDEGLEAMAREMGGGRLREVTQTLARDLHDGHPLPEALARQGQRVPPYYAGLVSAALRSGKIADVLATLTVHARTMADLRALVAESLFYPAVILLFALALAAGLLFFVLPLFDEIFLGFGMRLPWVTELLVRMSRHPWPVVIVPLVALVLLLVLRAVLRSKPSGRRTWARLVYAVPVVGTLIRSSRMAAFTDLLAILVEQGLPLPEAFRLAGLSAADPLMAATAQEVHDDLAAGQSLHEALHQRGLVPEWVAWMAGLGERRGSLAETLHQVAALYRRQAEMRAALLRNVLPPFLVILTAGAFVTVFVMALMLPMFKLLEGLSK